MAMRSHEFMGDAGKFSVTFPTSIRTSPINRTHNVNSAIFSLDGMNIVSASDDKTAWIWNTITGECELELTGHSDRVRSAVFSPDGMYIVSASNGVYTRRVVMGLGIILVIVGLSQK